MIIIKLNLLDSVFIIWWEKLSIALLLPRVLLQFGSEHSFVQVLLTFLHNLTTSNLILGLSELEDHRTDSDYQGDKSLLGPYVTPRKTPPITNQILP